LEKRIERHLRKTKQKFWHIDYLLDDANVEVLKVFHKKAGRLEECKIAKNISEIGVPVKGFGSSDCKCESHLFKLKGYQFLREFMLETILPIWQEETLWSKTVGVFGLLSCLPNVLLCFLFIFRRKL